MDDPRRPVRVPDLKARKLKGEKITVLTAYDATMAGLLDRAGIDVLLVGDSLGMVIQGHATTLPVTLDAMVHHTAAVSRGASRALVVADMPFLVCHLGQVEALRGAGRLVQEGGAAAVKIEGGGRAVAVTRRLVEAGIPVMGHLGLTPQSVHVLGGFRPQGLTPEAADRLLEEARALEEAGAFSVVLESIPAAVAGGITRDIGIPTIGIGAGPDCDGQVLVSYDAFGLCADMAPPFVRQYASLGETILSAARRYAEEVRSGKFPPGEPAPP